MNTETAFQWVAIGAFALFVLAIVILMLTAARNAWKDNELRRGLGVLPPAVAKEIMKLPPPVPTTPQEIPPPPAAAPRSRR